MSNTQNKLKDLMEEVLGICEIVPAENAQLPLCAMAEMLARHEQLWREAKVKTSAESANLPKGGALQSRTSVSTAAKHSTTT